LQNGIVPQFLSAEKIMGTRYNWLAVLALALLLPSNQIALAAATVPDSGNPNDQHWINRLAPQLVGQLTPELFKRDREQCALGFEPRVVAEIRSTTVDGHMRTFPDAGVFCVELLRRAAREDRLPDFYSDHHIEHVPYEIRDYVAAKDKHTPAQDAWMGSVKPGTAFDAGFTVAYQEGAALPASKVDPAKLEAVVEACFNEKSPATTCYSIGYVQGSLAHPSGSISQR
jgi:hypothetical protein